jgi:hypothetical protein
MNVTEFVRREASLPPYPGACCRMVDRWICEKTGFSALSRFGRDFRTEEDVKAWLAEPGGIAVAVNRVMRAAGIPKTKDPKPGDVGLVFHKGRLCMAVFDGAMWFSRDENGMIGVPSSALWKAWSL